MKKNDTVWILGTSESIASTPWNKKDADYWACWPVATVPASQGNRIDVLFELHDEKTWSKYKDVILDYHEQHPKTVIYMQRIFKDLEFANVFPIDKIQDSIKNLLLKRYFTNTIAFMIAFAIYEGYKNIKLCGINLCVEEEEYSMQRACVEAWLAYAIGKDIDIEIVKPSALFNIPYMYGYEGHKDVQIKLIQLKESSLLGLSELQKKLRMTEDEYRQQEGAVRMLNYLISDVFKGASNE